MIFILICFKNQKLLLPKGMYINLSAIIFPCIHITVYMIDIELFRYIKVFKNYCKYARYSFLRNKHSLYFVYELVSIQILNIQDDDCIVLQDFRTRLCDQSFIGSVIFQGTCFYVYINSLSTIANLDFSIIQHW